MTLSHDDRKAIIDYRIEKAFETLKEAKYVANGGFWNLCANRLYYSVFYACEALLLSKAIMTSTHAGVTRMMNLHFVKTDLLNQDDKDLLTNLFRMRQTGDYDDLSDWTEKSVVPFIEPTEDLIKKIINLI